MTHRPDSGQPPAPEACGEPPIARWTHAIEAGPPEQDALTYYLRCSLSYQNQLLSEIRVLLEQLVNLREESTEKK